MLPCVVLITARASGVGEFSRAVDRLAGCCPVSRLADCHPVNRLADCRLVNRLADRRLADRLADVSALDRSHGLCYHYQRYAPAYVP